jgi:hypothetical protein
MKKFDEPMAKVKALTKTRFNKEDVKKGDVLDVPEQVLELNPTIFERVNEEPDAAKPAAKKDEK